MKAHWDLELLPEEAFQKIGKNVKLYKKGGGGSAPTSQTVTQTNLPEYARPYFENLLNRTQAQSYQEYQPYGAPRIAGFTPEQQSIQQGIANLQNPGQFNQATQGLNLAGGMGAAGAGAGLNQALAYQPTNYREQQVSAPGLRNYGMAGAQSGYNPNLQNYQMASPANVSAPGLQNFGMGAAQSNYNPNLQNYQMATPTNVLAPSLQNFGMTAARSDYNPNLQNYQMAGPQNVASQNFGQAAADYYSNPYQQNVTNMALREAAQKGALDKNALMSGAIGRGTFGGARNALLQAEQTRGLNQQLGDIQMQGSQQGYLNAQQQFQADQARRMQADIANQQAGLTSGQTNLQALLQTQGLGAGIGKDIALANMTNEQQANVQNLASQLQTQGLSASQALQSALANQQASLTSGQTNLQALLQTQGLGAGIGKDIALANMTNEQQANVQNLASQLQTQGLSASQALQAALANQQAGLTSGQANLQANLQTQGLGAGIGKDISLANLSNVQQANVQNLASQLQTQGLSASQALQAALANQQAGLSANQQNQQSQQYAAGLGQQLYNTGLGGVQSAATGLGALGAQEQASNLARLDMQQKGAAQQQALTQTQLDTAYQDFLRQRDYPQEQLGFYSNILRGLPVQLASTASTYAEPPSVGSQIAGLGLAGLGLAKGFGG